MKIDAKTLMGFLDKIIASPTTLDFNECGIVIKG